MRQYNKIEKRNTIIWFCILLVLGIGIGYAILTEKIQLSGFLDYNAMSWDVGFTSALDGGGSVEAVPVISSDRKTITVSCNVGTSTNSETCIAKATIKNGSSFDVQLENKPSITFDDTYINSVGVLWSDTSVALFPGDVIASGKEKEIKIIVTTKLLTEDLLPEESLDIPISITLDWVEERGFDDTTILYKGKVASVLGDSISTLKGYIPSTNRPRYVQTTDEATGGLLYMPYENTWWGGVINDLGMTLGVNESWAGSLVSNTSTSNSGDRGPDRHMASLTRLGNLDNNGTPDVILFYGGTNDIGASVTLGTFDPSIELDLTSTVIDNFADAYAQTILRIKYLYPNAEIISLLPTYTSSYYSVSKLSTYNEVIKQVCTHYGIKYIELTKSGITTSHLADGIHPNAEGMKLIKDYVVKNMVSNVNDDENEEDNLEAINYYNYSEVLSGYYGVNQTWEIATTSAPVHSVILDVEPGMLLYSNSFKAKNVNGSGKTDGIRVTFLKDGVIVSSLSPDEVYNEYITNGFITVPDGVNEVNVPWWNLSDDNYLYVLNDSSSSNIPAAPEGWDTVNYYTTETLYNEYYDSANTWQSYDQVVSVLIDVNPGDVLLANSFSDKNKNGCVGTINFTDGIRLTFLKDGAIVSSMTPAEVYEEYKLNGYITVPDGVDEVNVPWWKPADNNYLYIARYGTIPEIVKTNYYKTLEVFDKYYDGTGTWTTYQNVVSVLVSVNPGDKLRANSFGSGATNGNSANVNGIRITYLKDGSIVKTLTTTAVYEEFNTYGYITVPDGVDEVNVPWWTSSPDNYLYINE